MKPNDKKMHMFDLDGTLWNIESKVWILDKEKSHKPILRLDEKELNNILNGVYVKDNLKIEYNGENFHISNDLFEKITKKKKITIEQLGLSWIEYYDDKYINNTKTTYLFKNINHLRNKKEYVCLLSGRTNRERHAKKLNELRKKLKEIGVDIFKIYFVSDRFYNKHTHDISVKKTYKIIEHLVGVKIENDKFTPLKQDWFNNICFYDDLKMNIDYANDIQRIFETILKHTDDELYDIIIERVTKHNLTLNTNLITNNELNLFKSEKIILKVPLKFPTNI